MQTKGLHKGIYKLYGYARKQVCLDAYRKKIRSNRQRVGAIQGKRLERRPHQKTR